MVSATMFRKNVSDRSTVTSTNKITKQLYKSQERICSNWAQSTDRQAKTLDSHALLVAALMVAKSRSRS
uniref:Uncharacterized protein n=1 Tax=Rhodnius prolixus TaxID=13249 RepID=T1I4S2_RHOPR